MKKTRAAAVRRLDEVASVAAYRAMAALRGRLMGLGWSHTAMNCDAEAALPILQRRCEAVTPSMIRELEALRDSGVNTKHSLVEVFVSWYVREAMETADERNAVYPAGRGVLEDYERQRRDPSSGL